MKQNFQYFYFKANKLNNILFFVQHGDHNAKKDRIRERGIIHVGADPAYHEPASWQVGREKWVERQDAEMDIIKVSIYKETKKLCLFTKSCKIQISKEDESSLYRLLITKSKFYFQEHIEQYNLKVGKHGYETPFDTYQA